MDQMIENPASGDVSVKSPGNVSDDALDITGTVGRARRSRRLLPVTRRVRVRTLIALLAATAVAMVVAVVITRDDDGDDASSGTTVKTDTAKVTRRDLVVTEKLTGDLGFANARDLSAHRTGVVTSIAKEGATVPQGKPLYAVNLEPTVLLKGNVPAYRTLDNDSSNGPDVKQLESALKEMGYGKNLTVDRNFTAATGDAVEEWEKDLGRDDPDGKVELGDVVFAPGPLRVSNRLVSVGSQVQDSTAVLAVTSTAKVVDVDLDVDKADLIAPKDAVTVSLPDDTETPGRVASVGTQSESNAADPQADPTVPMVVTLLTPKDSASFDSGSVDITIERSREDDVLAVPVTALLALAEGGYALQVVDPGNASGYKLLAVKAGTIAGDFVEVTGDGLAEGLEVVVPA